MNFNPIQLNSSFQQLPTENPLPSVKTLPKPFPVTVPDSGFQLKRAPEFLRKSKSRKKVERPIFSNRAFVSDEKNREKIVEKLKNLHLQFPELTDFILNKRMKLTPEKYHPISLVFNELGSPKAEIIASPNAKKRLFEETMGSVYIIKLQDSAKYVGKVGELGKPSITGRTVAKRTNEHLIIGSTSYFDRVAQSIFQNCDPESSEDNIQIGVIPADILKELHTIGLNIEQAEFLVTAVQVFKRDNMLELDKENVSSFNIINTKVPSVRGNTLGAVDSDKTEKTPLTIAALLS